MSPRTGPILKQRRGPDGEDDLPGVYAFPVSVCPPPAAAPGTPLAAASTGSGRGGDGTALMAVPSSMRAD